MRISGIRLSRGFIGLHRLTGPLVSKELRVAGRRRRSYALRSAYILILMVFIASVWVGVVQLRRPLAVQRVQMELAAKVITRGIVWFQFVAAQVVAVIIMSTTISDEIYGRTLGVLMTTPLSSSQLVMGKLFSRLLQILLLVATSLPLLAIVRVLGGIPWAYLLLSFALTLATVVFVGSVSLLFSTLSRKVYVVVIASSLSLAFLFGVLPFLSSFLLDSVFSKRFLAGIISYLNPYVLLTRCTDYMISPRRNVVVSVLSVACCCTLLLAGSAGLLGLSVGLVRRVALRRVMGQPTFLDFLRPSRWLQWPSRGQSRKQAVSIRRVVGPPMVWKELTCALSRRQKLAVRLTVGIEILLVCIVYTFPAFTSIIGYGETHVLYLWTFLGLGVLFTVSTPATLISAERESGTWPLLLVTPLRDRDIFVGKCAGVLRRCGPVWLSLFAYIAMFAAGRCYHPLAVIQIAIIIVSVLVFLTATGFYFGTRFDRATEAVTANFILAGVLWCILPVIGHWVAGAYHQWNDGEFFAAVPFAQTLLLTATTLTGGDGRFRWFEHTWHAGSATGLMFAVMLVYLVGARLFLWRAVHGFRRHIV